MCPWTRSPRATMCSRSAQVTTAGSTTWGVASILTLTVAPVRWPLINIPELPELHDLAPATAAPATATDGRAKANVPEASNSHRSLRSWPTKSPRLADGQLLACVDGRRHSRSSGRCDRILIDCRGERSMYDTPDTQSLEDARPVTAPDGSTVRPLCRITGLGSFAHFQLEPGEISKAVSHATVQEIWYIIGGTGQMWRRQKSQEPEPEPVALRPGICLTIPLGTTFQFRADDGTDPLRVVAVTMPPWPDNDEHESRSEHGPWSPTFRH